MAGNYWSALGLNIAENTGAREASVASQALSGASSSIEKALTGQEKAYEASVNASNSFGNLLGNDKSGWTSIAKMMSDEEKISNKNAIEQFAKQQEDNRLAQERFDIAKSISQTLSDNASLAQTGLTKSQFSNAIDTAITKELGDLDSLNQANLTEKQKKEKGFVLPNAITLTPELVRAFIKDETSFYAAEASGRLTDKQKEALMKIKGNTALVKAIKKWDELDTVDSLRAQGYTTPQEAEIISKEAYKYVTGGFQTKTERDIFNEYITSGRVNLNMKQDESLEDYLKRIQQARNAIDVQRHLGFNLKDTQQFKGGNSSGTTNPNTKGGGTSKSKSSQSSKTDTTNLNLNYNYGVTDVNTQQTNLPLDTQIQGINEQIEADNQKDLTKNTDSSNPMQYNGEYLMNVDDILNSENPMATLQQEEAKLKPEYRKAFREYVGLKGELEQIELKYKNDNDKIPFDYNPSDNPVTTLLKRGVNKATNYIKKSDAVGKIKERISGFEKHFYPDKLNTSKLTKGGKQIITNLETAEANLEDTKKKISDTQTGKWDYTKDDDVKRGQIINNLEGKLKIDKINKQNAQGDAIASAVTNNPTSYRDSNGNSIPPQDGIDVMASTIGVTEVQFGDKKLKAKNTFYNSATMGQIFSVIKQGTKGDSPTVNDFLKVVQDDAKEYYNKVDMSIDRLKTKAVENVKAKFGNKKYSQEEYTEALSAEFERLTKTDNQFRDEINELFERINQIRTGDKGTWNSIKKYIPFMTPEKEETFTRLLTTNTQGLFSVTKGGQHKINQLVKDRIVAIGLAELTNSLDFKKAVEIVGLRN